MGTVSTLSRHQSALASAVAADVVRHDDSRLADSRVPLGAAGGALTGTYPNPTLGVVPNPPVAVTYAASLTVDASLGNYRVCTATGNLTMNTPINSTDGQLLRVRFIASGTPCVITLAAGLQLTTGQTTTLTVQSGKRGDIGLLYEAANGWTVLSAVAQL